MSLGTWPFARLATALEEVALAPVVRKIRQNPKELYWKLKLVEACALGAGDPYRRVLVDALCQLIGEDLDLMLAKGLPAELFRKWAWADAARLVDAYPRSSRADLIEATFIAEIADRCDRPAPALERARAALDRLPGAETMRADAWAVLQGDILVRQDPAEFERRFARIERSLRASPSSGSSYARWLEIGTLGKRGESRLRSALKRLPPQNRGAFSNARLTKKKAPT